MAKKKMGFNFSNLTSLLLLGVVIILIGIIFSRFDPTAPSTEPNKNLKLYYITSARFGTFVEDTEEEGRYTLTFQGTTPTLTYIARNPDNYFGRVQLGGFITAVWGDDSQFRYTEDAPNGVLTVYNPNTNQEDVIELELTDPQIQGNTIQFTATQASSRPRVKSFFDDNLTDFPVEFTNPTLVIDLAKSDIQGNMLEIITAAETSPTPAQ